MTDRIHSLTVVLENNMRVDDIDALHASIRSTEAKVCKALQKSLAECENSEL